MCMGKEVSTRLPNDHERTVIGGIIMGERCAGRMLWMQRTCTSLTLFPAAPSLRLNGFCKQPTQKWLCQRFLLDLKSPLVLSGFYSAIFWSWHPLRRVAV